MKEEVIVSAAFMVQISKLIWPGSRADSFWSIIKKNMTGNIQQSNTMSIILVLSNMRNMFDQVG